MKLAKLGIILALSIFECESVQALAQVAPEIQELRARAESGDARAQFNLGVRYYEGDGVPNMTALDCS